MKWEESHYSQTKTFQLETFFSVSRHIPCWDGTAANLGLMSNRGQLNRECGTYERRSSWLLHQDSSSLVKSEVKLIKSSREHCVICHLWWENEDLKPRINWVSLTAVILMFIFSFHIKAHCSTFRFTKEICDMEDGNRFALSIFGCDLRERQCQIWTEQNGKDFSSSQKARY